MRQHRIGGACLSLPATGGALDRVENPLGGAGSENRGQTGLPANFRQKAPEIHGSSVSPRRAHAATPHGCSLPGERRSPLTDHARRWSVPPREYTPSMSPNTGLSPIISQLREDLAFRRMECGMRRLAARAPALEALDPAEPNAGVLLGLIAQWVDAGFAGPELVRRS